MDLSMMISILNDSHEYASLEKIAEEVDETVSAGARKQIYINAYERNPKARKEALNYWGYLCSVCKFDFAAVYGDIGKEYIHVHHLTPVSELDDGYQIDPIKELRPVCPNCHSMLHRTNPACSIEDLIDIYKASMSKVLSFESENEKFIEL